MIAWSQAREFAASLPEDLRPLWDELDERYKISQYGPGGNGDFPQLHRCDLYGLETWLSQISFFTKELVAKDLKLVEMLADDLSRSSNELKRQLRYRSNALASLDQTGMPQPMKVLCLLLRELWETRITDGTSKLAEQPTSILQDLSKLIQKAMEDWENVKRLDHWWSSSYSLARRPGLQGLAGDPGRGPEAHRREARCGAGS